MEEEYESKVKKSIKDANTPYYASKKPDL
nr:ribosomal protein L22 [Albizia julibrissin]